ncbi:MAG: gamma-glutamyl-gamma-aminobutyrate hydrolase family protein, partial [Nitrospinae bacterium]|nr:gamma-glutamyl-gamma-aminobutyrate hydrolase family protein [Nitrospinota bacterium]
EAASYLALIDGLLISGGDFDIDPSFYGEERIPQCAASKPDRTLMEFALYRGASKRGMPVLGVCGGHQVINVAHKGSLYQDIPSQTPTAARHSQRPIPPTKPSHTVRLAKGSSLEKIAGTGTLKVNSTHHQGVKGIGKGVTVEGVAPDGMIEAISVSPPSGSWVVGVQWHPEALYPTDEPSRKLFARFVAEARRYKRKSG